MTSLHFFKAMIPFAISSASGTRGQLSISSGNEDVSKLFHFGVALGKQALIQILHMNCPVLSIHNTPNEISYK